MSRNELVDLELVILAETDLAVMVHNDKDAKVWLPKSLIEIDGDITGKGRPSTVTMPTWLAEERELS